MTKAVLHELFEEQEVRRERMVIRARKMKVHFILQSINLVYCSQCEYIQIVPSYAV